MKKILFLMCAFFISIANALTTYEAISIDSNWTLLTPSQDGNNYLNIENITNVTMEYTTDNSIQTPPRLHGGDARLGIDTPIYIRTIDDTRTGTITIERY